MKAPVNLNKRNYDMSSPFRRLRVVSDEEEAEIAVARVSTNADAKVSEFMEILQRCKVSVLSLCRFVEIVVSLIELLLTAVTTYWSLNRRLVALTTVSMWLYSGE